MASAEYNKTEQRSWGYSSITALIITLCTAEGKSITRQVSRPKPNLTSKSCVPCSSISETNSVMGRGSSEGKCFLESVTSVGHSSSDGRPITLKPKSIVSEPAAGWIIHQYDSSSSKRDGRCLLLTQKSFPVGPLRTLHRTTVWTHRAII